MLVATGDRTLRHLRAVLTEPVPDVLPAWARRFATAIPDLATAAAVQAADDEALRRWWPALLADQGGADAGRRLDAIVFALTGLRIATGVGVDEGWLRLRPWLPPGHHRLELRGLLAEGAVLDVAITARCGPRHADEGDDHAILAADPGPRLRVRVTIRSAAGQRVRVVLEGRGAQYVTSLDPGAVFERSLPTAPPP
jgi:hypothetical protein